MSRQGVSQHALDGGVLQNGYQLQHYRYAGNDFIDGSSRFSQTIATAPEPQFQAMVNRARQMGGSLRRLQRSKGPDIWEQMGMPRGPDPMELLATGDRAYVLASLEHARQEQLAAYERMDPGGRRAETQLELMDRSYTEEKKKRRDKRNQGPSCIVM